MTGIFSRNAIRLDDEPETPETPEKEEGKASGAPQGSQPQT